MSAPARRRCRCGDPPAPDSADRCIGCEQAGQVLAAAGIWGDRVACPTCDYLANGDPCPTGGGGLRSRWCLDDERRAGRDREDG